MNKFILIFAAALSCSTGAVEQKWTVIDGQQKIARESLSDPEPFAPKVAYFTIRGVGARSIYLALPSNSAVIPACGDAGLTARFAGNMVCYQKAKRYSCEYGIRLSDGALVPGRSC
jgi:hypothetical protein